MDPPSKQRSQHPPEPLHHRGLYLYGDLGLRPYRFLRGNEHLEVTRRRVRAALKTLQRLPVHISQHSCTVRAIREWELSLNTMALLVSKVVCRFWRSPNQCSSVVGRSGYFITEALQECGSGSDEDVVCCAA